MLPIRRIDFLQFVVIYVSNSNMVMDLNWSNCEIKRLLKDSKVMHL